MITKIGETVNQHFLNDPVYRLKWNELDDERKRSMINNRNWHLSRKDNIKGWKTSWFDNQGAPRYFEMDDIPNDY